MKRIILAAALLATPAYAATHPQSNFVISCKQGAFRVMDYVPGAPEKYYYSVESEWLPAIIVYSTRTKRFTIAHPDNINKRVDFPNFILRMHGEEAEFFAPDNSLAGAYKYKTHTVEALISNNNKLVFYIRGAQCETLPLEMLRATQD